MTEEEERKDKLKKKLIKAGAFLLAIIVTIINTGTCLQLRDLETGEVIWKAELANKEVFSISCQHSVTESEVKEEYQLQGDTIFLTGSSYVSPGDDISDNIRENSGLSRSSTSSEIDVSFYKEMNGLIYAIDHDAGLTLHYREQEISFDSFGASGDLIALEIIIYPYFLL